MRVPTCIASSLTGGQGLLLCNLWQHARGESYTEAWCTRRGPRATAAAARRMRRAVRRSPDAARGAAARAMARARCAQLLRTALCCMLGASRLCRLVRFCMRRCNGPNEVL